MWNANSGGGEGMIRRLFTAASVLSLLAALLLGVAAVCGTLGPGQWAWVHNHTLQYVELGPKMFGWTRVGRWPSRDEPFIRTGPNRTLIPWMTGYRRSDFGIGGRYSGTAYIFVGYLGIHTDFDPWNHPFAPGFPSGGPPSGPAVGCYLRTRLAFILAMPLPMARLADWFWRRRRRQVRGFPHKPNLPLLGPYVPQRLPQSMGIGRIAMGIEMGDHSCAPVRRHATLGDLSRRASSDPHSGISRRSDYLLP